MTGMRKRSTDPRLDQTKMTAREEEVAAYNNEQAYQAAKEERAKTFRKRISKVR